MPFDWSAYATGGATRPDSFSGMNPDFAAALQRMFESAPPEIRDRLRVSSGYRSVERQRQLWEASDKSGRMVARPGHSQHNHGNAADLRFVDPEARAWVHDNAAQYGLTFPMSYEPRHIELAGARNSAPQSPGGLANLVVPASERRYANTPGTMAPPISSQIAARPPEPPQAPGTPAPPLHTTTIDGPPAQNAPSIPDPVMAQAEPQKTNSVWDVLGTMAAAPQPEQPQFQPVEFRGPTAEQANALTSFIQSLLQQRMV